MSELSNVEKKSEKKPKQKNNKIKLLDHVFEHMTTVAHVCVVSFTSYIVYLCFSDTVVLFTWHPLLFSIGWMLLMTEAVLMISKENIFSNRISHKLRIKYHWILQALAVLLSTIAFIIVIIVKENNNRPHFTSWHGIMGLSSIIFCYITTLGGVLALYNTQLKKYITPKINKFAHALGGIISVALGGATIVLSLYTGWFSTRTTENQDIFFICYIAVCFSILWCLVRPIITCMQRLKNF